MLRTATFILASTIYLFSSQAKASNPPGKRPLLLYVGGGLTYNTVYGSMVDRNNRFNDETMEMRNKSGFQISFQLEKQISDYIYIRTGISYIRKQVNPMEYSSSVYWDRLKTGYLSIPVLAGINLLPPNKKLNFPILFGPSVNFRLTDNSYVGPDRVDFKTSFISASVNAGASLGYLLNAKTRIVLQYNYAHDISNTYVETLYWSQAEPDKKFTYRYQTSSIAVGFQWPVN